MCGPAPRLAVAIACGAAVGAIVASVAFCGARPAPGAHLFLASAGRGRAAPGPGGGGPESGTLDDRGPAGGPSQGQGRPRRRRYVLLALEDSGSTALERMLDSNFAGSRYSASPALEPGMRIWKHTHPGWLLHGGGAQPQGAAARLCAWCSTHTLRSLAPLAGSLVVIVVHRSPLPQLLAWRRVAAEHPRWPRPLSSCFGAPAGGWRQPCRPETEGNVIPGCCQMQPGRASFEDVVELWNSYQSGYIALVRELGRLGILSVLLGQKEVALNASGVLDKIGGLLGARPLGRYALRACDSCRREIVEETHLQWFAPDELRVICARLNRTVLATYGYNDCIGHF